MHAPALTTTAAAAKMPALDDRTAHARELAAYIEERGFGADDDGLHLGPTDAALAARALRSFAGCAKRQQRR